MLDLLDEQQSLTINQWKIFTACLFSTMLDFFDFFLISFALAFFVGDWHLTFGQSGMILFASGVSAIPGGWFFGWLGDRIGRRKVFMITVLTFSGATGLMALTPHGAWPFMVAMRFIVGFGNAGMVAVDLPLLQEFMPASKRGWVSGLATALLPAGPALAAALSASLGAIIGWRGLFAIGLLPAAMAFMIRVWVPESPRWLIGQGRVKEARRSLAWALQIDPEQISVPVEVAEVQRTSWAELFKYPRSIAVGCLTGLSQTGVAGLGLWGVVLLALILKVSPAEASFLAIWIGLTAVPGRAVGAWLSDLLGRRYAGILTGLLGAAAMLAAGYWHDVYVGAFSVYYLMLLAHGFIGGPRRQFRDRLPVHGRAVAGHPARQRLRFRLWHQQHWQVHRPGWSGGDRRRVQLRRAESNARCDRAGIHLLLVLVFSRRTGLPVDRRGDTRPHDRTARRRHRPTGIDRGSQPRLTRLLSDSLAALAEKKSDSARSNRKAHALRRRRGAKPVNPFCRRMTPG